MLESKYNIVKQNKDNTTKPCAIFAHRLSVRKWT